jgi:antagonist of KipI
MKGGVEILDAGMLMTVQDAGRFGYRKYGVPVSGALDVHAYRLVNWLVGNEPGEPVIEMTLQGGRFKFHQQAHIGITGADCEVYVNGEKSKINKSLFLESGDELSIGRGKLGCRSYLAIKGKWTIDCIMGSSSTCLAAGFGGLNGRTLQKRDYIFWENDGKENLKREVPKELIPHYSTRQTIRVITGPEWNYLPVKQQSDFLECTYHISSESNRMGLRLKSREPLEFDYPEMKSAPVVPGIIQLPKSGAPIILMNDSQSVGGYPRIAKVADADLWRLAQLWIGNEIRFKMINQNECFKLSTYFNDLISKLEAE